MCAPEPCGVDSGTARLSTRLDAHAASLRAAMAMPEANQRRCGGEERPLRLHASAVPRQSGRRVGARAAALNGRSSAGAALAGGTLGEAPGHLQRLVQELLPVHAADGVLGLLLRRVLHHGIALQCTQQPSEYFARP